jgi:hypothetical protein
LGHFLLNQRKQGVPGTLTIDPDKESEILLFLIGRKIVCKFLFKHLLILSETTLIAELENVLKRNHQLQDHEMTLRNLLLQNEPFLQFHHLRIQLIDSLSIIALHKNKI